MSPVDQIPPALVAAAAAGGEHAARELIAACNPLVARIAHAHRPRTLGEDDLVQEVFVKLFANLDRYAPQDGIPFAHWLSRLAVNVCRDALRAEARRPRAQRVDDAGSASAGLDWLIGGHVPAVEDALAARDLVERLLAELPPSDRLVLTLLDLEGRSVAEIAALTGWSRTLVKVRAFRARRRLRSAAERLGGEP